MANLRWRPFADARTWAQEMHLQSAKQWRELRAQGKLPDDIPASPDYVYRDQWKSWGDFLGNGYVASQNRRYRSFESAREWARVQGIQSRGEWVKLAREGRVPQDIPANAWQIYRNEWKGIGDFLGNDYVATYNRTYRSFDEARLWAHTQGLQSEAQWRKRSKQAGWLPSDIPVGPYNVYKAEWTSWGDFLGTDYVGTLQRLYRSFADAREWAHAQCLKSSSDWNRHTKKAGWLPRDIPADPRSGYGKEFTSFGDFLGTENLAPSQYQWRSFHEARTWAQEQRLDDLVAWAELVKSLRAIKQWPIDIPSNASLVYSSQWRGWEDFLGVPRMAKRSKIEERLRHELAALLPIDLAIRRIQVAGTPARNVDVCAPSLRLVIEFDGNYWHRTAESEARDREKTKQLMEAGWTVVRIREHPLELIGPNDLQVPKKQNAFRLTLLVLKHLTTLGYVTPEVAVLYEVGGQAVNRAQAATSIRTVWRPFAEAQAWVQARGVKSQAQWDKLSKQEGWLPADIPRYPREVYVDEWTTLGDFLGTGRVANLNREYRPFEQAREWARAKQVKSQTQWVKFAKQPEWLPVDIPATPYNVYKESWVSWGDFLGTGNRASRDYDWRPFASARAWAQTQSVRSREGWLDLYRNKKMPDDIPASPQSVYKGEWIGWRDFLGKLSTRTQ